MRVKKDALASRIKKMMQTDDDVGKISQATPVLIGTTSIQLQQFDWAWIRMRARFAAWPRTGIQFLRALSNRITAGTLFSALQGARWSSSFLASVQRRARWLKSGVPRPLQRAMCECAMGAWRLQAVEIPACAAAAMRQGMGEGGEAAARRLHHTQHSAPPCHTIACHACVWSMRRRRLGRPAAPLLAPATCLGQSACHYLHTLCHAKRGHTAPPLMHLPAWTALHGAVHISRRLRSLSPSPSPH